MAFITGSRLRARQFAGSPVSGTSGTFAGDIEAGSFVWDTTHGVEYVNEGTVLSPYYTPTSITQRGLFGVQDDFNDKVGVAIAGSAMSVTKAGSGVRIFGDGGADNDSGAVAIASVEGGNSMDLTTTDEDLHGLAFGMDAGIMQPDQHGGLVVDARFTMETALTDRSIALGFVGVAIDAFVAPVTGAGTTATLVQDDQALMIMDSGLTDADGIFAVHNKSNAAATQDLTVDGDLSATIAAVGTYQRWRVEIGANGNMLCFINKAQVYSQAIALDVDEECSPILYLQARAAAIKKLSVSHFDCWASNVVA